MKKILTLTLIMCAILCGCADSESNVQDTTVPIETTTAQTTTTAETTVEPTVITTTEAPTTVVTTKTPDTGDTSAVFAAIATITVASAAAFVCLKKKEN